MCGVDDIRKNPDIYENETDIYEKERRRLLQCLTKEGTLYLHFTQITALADTLIDHVSEIMVDTCDNNYIKIKI